eukprot:TRINITY_DN27227_c0_g1_i1.p1 TRINITY_DN27227_c0_g1~~TRINITY_DN27227_c0_g1_i1.p1  ORF type:complete len:742 (+),score=156.64 TRINITY_DN27227_c0_g1_i1:65-2290(+)
MVFGWFAPAPPPRSADPTPAPPVPEPEAAPPPSTAWDEAGPAGRLAEGEWRAEAASVGTGSRTPQRAPETWRVAYVREGASLVRVTLLLPRAGGGGAEEECGVHFVEDSPVRGRCAPPSLLAPKWVAVGQHHVHWIEGASAAKLYVLTQAVDAAVGGADGVLRVLRRLNSTEADDEAAQMVGSMWDGNALRQSLPAPWWADRVPAARLMLQDTASLPPPLRTHRFCYSGYVWTVEDGWFSTSQTLYWLTLHYNTLVFAASPTAPVDHLREYALAGVEVRVGETVSVPVPDAKPVRRHPLTLTPPAASGFKPLSLLFHSSAERGLWAALLAVSAGQLSGAVDAKAGGAYATHLTRVPAPPATPSLQPGSRPEDLSDCSLSGLLAADGGEESGGWLLPGRKRRAAQQFLTLHSTYVTSRASQENVRDVVVLPLRHAVVKRSSSSAGGPDRPWMLKITSPFFGTARFFCETEATLWTWLRALGAAVAAANAGSETVPAVCVDRVDHGGDASTLAELLDAALGVSICAHGIEATDAMALEYAETSPWRQLLSPQGLLGSEAREAAFIGESTDMEWVAEAGGRAPLAPPLHVVVRGKTAADVRETPAIPADCFLPECSVLVGSPLRKLAGKYAITSSVVIRLPEGTEQVLSRGTGCPRWLAVLSGELRVVVFPPRTYALLLSAKETGHQRRIPVGWGRVGAPLAHLGGKQLTLTQGSAAFVPAEYLLAYTALAAADVAVCSCDASA